LIAIAGAIFAEDAARGTIEVQLYRQLHCYLCA
jgi:hypothetical protein